MADKETFMSERAQQAVHNQPSKDTFRITIEKVSTEPKSSMSWKGREEGYVQEVRRVEVKETIFEQQLETVDIAALVRLLNPERVPPRALGQL